MVAAESKELQIAQFFTLPAGTDKEVAKVASDMQKQENFISYLPTFIKENGIPRWDKVFYKVGKKNISGIKQETASAARETMDDSGTQGLFFIPLQSTNENEIKGYVTCYKHNDSSYTYKLFNKDSLNALRPSSDTAKTKWLNAMSVFGFFEKNINGRDSILVEGSGRGYLKNAQLAISEADGNTAGRGVETLSFPSGNGCSYKMVVTETFTYLEIYENGMLTDVYSNYSVQVAVTVICTGNETPPPGIGGGGGGWNWYNYGTGGYFNSNSPVNGDYWWTNTLDGGVGGGSNGIPPTTDPCAEAAELAETVTNLSKKKVYNTSKTSIQNAGANGNEYSVTFGTDGSGIINASGISGGGGSSGTVNTGWPGAFADLHNHPNNEPPSNGDFYKLIDVNNNHPRYNIRMVVTPDGSVYALAIVDLAKANAFNNNYPPQDIGFGPDLPELLNDELIDLKNHAIGQGFDDLIAKEMALAFLLDKYNCGVALLKQDVDGKFKRIQTTETVNSNGIKIYNQANCL